MTETLKRAASTYLAAFADRLQRVARARDGHWWAGVGLYLWTAFLFIPGGLVTFFKAGPFAWNGLLAFWVAAAVFGSWFIVMSVVVRRAVAPR